MKTRLAGAVGALLLYCACSGTSGSSVSGGRPAGTEGGPCSLIGTGCNAGLVCVSDICVKKDAIGDPPSGGPDATPDAAPSSDGGVDARGDAPFDLDGASCAFSHPLVDGGARTCAPGKCYCAQRDSCYSTAVASACCFGNNVTCY